MAMAIDEPSHSAQDNSMAQQPLPPPSLPLFLDAPEREDTPLKVQLSAAERGKVWEERLECVFKRVFDRIRLLTCCGIGFLPLQSLPDAQRVILRETSTTIKAYKIPQGIISTSKNQK